MTIFTAIAAFFRPRSSACKRITEFTRYSYTIRDPGKPEHFYVSVNRDAQADHAALRGRPDWRTMPDAERLQRIRAVCEWYHADECRGRMLSDDGEVRE